MIFNAHEIANLDSKFKLNLINNIGGIKPGNLIGTKSSNGDTNLAIFFSIMHLQSDPPLLGLMLRPHDVVRRDSWENIKETGFFTVNGISENMVERAHFTSAKIDSKISEFDCCGFDEQYLDDFPAPFVKESLVKIGVKYLDNQYIKLSKTTLVIGQIELIFLPDNALNFKGYVDFERLNAVGIGGLNSYYSVAKIADYPYARIDNIPDF